ncbi:MAG: histidine kinase [Saprospiraceae bacterium]|nr:histidine kinase [Saprospiraceae bacterium]
MEDQLLQTPASPDKLSALERLVGYYTYTDIEKATAHLGKMKALLSSNVSSEFHLAYHWYAGQLKNQLYQYQDSEEHYKNAVSIITEIGDVSQMSEIMLDRVGTLINLGDWKTTGEILDRIESYRDQLSEPRIEYRIKCRKGFLNLHLGNYPEALEDLFQAERLLDDLEDTPNLKDYYFLCLIQSGISTIYQKTGDLHKAVQASIKVVDLCETLGMKTRLSWHYLSVGNCFLALDRKDKAKLYFQKALESEDDLSKKARAGATANLGYLDLADQKYESALPLFEQAEKLYHQNASDDYHNFSVISNWKARLYAEQMKDDLALQHYEKALQSAQEGEDYQQLSNLCYEIAEFFADSEDFEKAYQYQLLHGEMEEKFREKQGKKQLLELEIKYKAEAQRKEAEMLKLESSRLALKALRAQMNPHFLHNCLNAIQRFITSEDSDTAARYLAKFSRLMRQSLEYSEEEIITLESEIEFLENYLDIFQKLRFEQFVFEIKIDPELEEDIVRIPTMIIQPYVENALEHGLRSRDNGKVTIEFIYMNEDQLKCVVHDNGIGRKAAALYKSTQSEKRNYRSMGTSITEERLKILNGDQDTQVSVETIDLQDESGNPLGTSVEILLPVRYFQKDLVTAS